MADDAESKSGMPGWSGRAGADGNFAELMQSNVGWIHAAAKRRLRDSALADDAVQAVFLALWSKYREPPERGHHLRGWLANTTRYICNNMRVLERRRVARERSAASEQAARRRLGADHTESEQLAALDAAMRRLPTGDRDILVARFYQGRSIREMAQTLGITEAATRKRTSRVLERLRAEICWGQSPEECKLSALTLILGRRAAFARGMRQISHGARGRRTDLPPNPVCGPRQSPGFPSRVAQGLGRNAVLGAAAAILAGAVVCCGPGGPAHREVKWRVRESGEAVGPQIATRLSPKRWPEINGSARKATGGPAFRKASLAVRSDGVGFASDTFLRFPSQPGVEALNGPNPVPGRESAEIGTTAH